MFMFVFVILQLNYILSLISLILGICFVNYIVVLIFTYYREKILKELVDEVNQKDIFIKSTDIGNEENADKE